MTPSIPYIPTIAEIGCDIGDECTFTEFLHIVNEKVKALDKSRCFRNGDRVGRLCAALITRGHTPEARNDALLELGDILIFYDMRHESYYLYTLALEKSDGVGYIAQDAMLGIAKLLKQGKMATNGEQLTAADDILLYLATILNFDEAKAQII